MSKLVTILGATGSVGVSALRVIESFADEFSVYGLSCRANVGLLRKQIQKFSPRAVAVAGEADISSLSAEFPHVEFLRGGTGSSRTGRA